MYLRLLFALVGMSVLIVSNVVACSSGSTSTTTPSTSTNAVISLSHDIQPIFNQNCVVCHQGNQPPGGLSLQAGSAYNNLVNVKSTESPLMRVMPGHPEQSYLINKLLGIQVQAGGSGAQMPFDSPPLTQSQIDLIEQWITEGAVNN